VLAVRPAAGLQAGAGGILELVVSDVSGGTVAPGGYLGGRAHGVVRGGRGVLLQVRVEGFLSTPARPTRLVPLRVRST